MFGFVSKKRLLQEMKRLKESGRKENNGCQYPPQDEKQMRMNLFFQGYTDGHDNFYNGLYGRLFKKPRCKP